MSFLRTDGDGEYIAGNFQRWLKARGIHYKVTNANTSQEIRVVEWLNKTVLEMVQTMMFDSKLPKAHWTFAVRYIQEILNRLSTRAVSEKKTPHELFLQKKPLVAHIQIFGYQAYMHISDERRGKLNPKMVKGFFIELSKNKRAYLITSSQNHLQLYESHNVTFMEDLQYPKQVRIKVSKDCKEENDICILNKMTGPQPPEE